MYFDQFFIRFLSTFIEAAQYMFYKLVGNTDAIQRAGDTNILHELIFITISLYVFIFLFHAGKSVESKRISFCSNVTHFCVSEN